MALSAILSGTGVTPANDSALLAPDAAGGLRLLAREGDAVPGGGGATFQEFSQVLLNEAGDVVVLARVQAPGLSYTVWTLLVAAAGQELRVVAQTEAPFEVAPGDVRSVLAFVELDPHLGSIRILPQSLSDARRFAFEASFLQGGIESSGLFLVSIPEPATAALALWGLLGLAAVRRVRAGGRRAACPVDRLR